MNGMETKRGMTLFCWLPGGGFRGDTAWSWRLYSRPNDINQVRVIANGQADSLKEASQSGHVVAKVHSNKQAAWKRAFFLCRPNLSVLLTQRLGMGIPMTPSA